MRGRFSFTVLLLALSAHAAEMPPVPLEAQSLTKIMADDVDFSLEDALIEDCRALSDKIASSPKDWAKEARDRVVRLCGSGKKPGAISTRFGRIRAVLVNAKDVAVPEDIWSNIDDSRDEERDGARAMLKRLLESDNPYATFKEWALEGVALVEEIEESLRDIERLALTADISRVMKKRGS